MKSFWIFDFGFSILGTDSIFNQLKGSPERKIILGCSLACGFFGFAIENLEST